MNLEPCPMGFDCLAMTDLIDCVFGGSPYCPNMAFCRSLVTAQPIQPRFFSELSNFDICDRYDPPFAEAIWDENAHFKMVRFPRETYSSSEILDLAQAGYAEAVYHGREILDSIQEINAEAVYGESSFPQE